MDTNPSHTKDFKEAAENHIQKYAGQITGSVFTIARSDIYNLREESFTEGCQHGYAEAMNELTEILLAREKEYHKGVLNDQFINGRFWECHDILEILSSFTEQEQSKPE
jgi:hypothetical protein